MARRRRFGKVELEDLVRWFSALPDPLLASLYKALGGNPAASPTMTVWCS
jgi:hypothetical protein